MTKGINDELNPIIELLEKARLALCKMDNCTELTDLAVKDIESAMQHLDDELIRED